MIQGTIRQVHLVSNDYPTLASIVLSLIPDDKTAQNENVESIIWRKRGYLSMDISDFFARSSLSKLRFLELSGNFRISSWDHLTSRTTLLTTLSLEMFESSPSPIPNPTISQLLSILISNPNLQKLRLTNEALPKDTDVSTLRVPLHHLKILSLLGDFRRLFGLLRQLILPETLDDMYLSGSNPTVEEVSQILWPYMLDHFRRDARFQDRLEVVSYSARSFISITVGVICALGTAPAPRVSLALALDGRPPDVLEQFFINLVLPTPRERIVSLVADLDTKLPEELVFMMLNIERLYLFNVGLSKRFLQPKPGGRHANAKLFPSLLSLRLEGVKLDDNDWGHLITYLIHQNAGGQTISLGMDGDLPYMPPEVVNEVEGLVKEFAYRPNPVGERGK